MDVTAADLIVSAREGYESIEHVKRYTTLGMGTDQGKLGNVNGIGVLADYHQTDPGSVGTTTYRPMYTPVTYGAMSGAEHGDLFDPVRKTAMHSWHVEHDALFEDVGQWKRPWYYPRGAESMGEAVNRECKSVRTSAGVLDASTLGKIDIKGPDAHRFLNRVYTNPFLKLPVGRCRYGLMLDENGMVIDDGVTARLGEHHFLMFTTSGGAARIMSWLELWLQTEWPDLELFLTSVTDHWATVSLCGPNARKIVQKLCSDLDLSNESFPFMSVRHGTVAGVAARIFRISFTGELTYEINVNANASRHLWEAVMEAGEEFQITPFGTEAMHVLRAEKGYVIVGQDTDGSVTPIDLGMARLVAGNKDFLGKRSLTRSYISQPDRKQFVGLLSEDPQTVLPEGGQIVDDPRAPLPRPMLGHVTSSYYSANMERSIALGLVKGGHGRKGDTVYVQDFEGGTMAALISDSVFYDPEGTRQNV
jgi:sarcosine oxidase subunit alpha